MWDAACGFFFFFIKLNITLTLFEGLNSGTFTAEIILKIVSSDKSCYSFEEKPFKFTSTQKAHAPPPQIVHPVAFQRISKPKNHHHWNAK